MRKIIFIVLIFILIVGGIRFISKRFGGSDDGGGIFTDSSNTPSLLKFLCQKWPDYKLRTYPKESSRLYRIGKFTCPASYDLSFSPTEEQIARLAPHCDSMFTGVQDKDIIPIHKKYNPDLTFVLFIDSGLNPGWVNIDAGSVDEENLDWILKNHSDWLIKDATDKPVVSGSRRGDTISNPGQYWPDPGNPEYQRYFAEKVNKLIQKGGSQFDLILMDQFPSNQDFYERYAGAEPQVNYKTEKDFQDIQIEFLEKVGALLPIPPSFLI